MIRTGKVMSIDKKSNSGIIRDIRGKDYFFSGVECYGEQLPPLYSTVTFVKDDDFKQTNVAMLIKLDQLPRSI